MKLERCMRYYDRIFCWDSQNKKLKEIAMRDVALRDAPEDVLSWTTASCDPESAKDLRAFLEAHKEALAWPADSCTAKNAEDMQAFLRYAELEKEAAGS